MCGKMIRCERRMEIFKKPLVANPKNIGRDLVLMKKDLSNIAIKFLKRNIILIMNK